MLAVETPDQAGDSAVSLGSLIKERRTRLGLTQKQVAEQADIGLSYYKQIETDRANPTVDKAASLVRVLSIDPRAIFRELGVDLGPDDDNPDLDDTDNAAFGAIKDVVEALRAVQDLFAKKPTSRRLPAVIANSEDVLLHTDLEDLEEAASVLGFQIDLLEDDDSDDDSEDEADDEETICQEFTSRLIIAAMYGDAFETADIGTLEAIANDIRDRVYGHRGFIQGKSWLFEDEDEYQDRLRRELAPHIVEAAKARQAPDLQNLFSDEEED